MTASPRRGTLLALLGTTVIVAIGSFLVGSHLASPAQVAANARAPKPTTPHVAVRYGVLRATVAFRADVTESSTVNITTPTSVPPARPVITSLSISRGAAVHEGQVVASVAERPLFVLQGRIQAFRAMKEGLHGIDVQQLQAALRRLGLFSGGDPRGTYGVATRAAVRQLYAGAGFTDPGGAVPLGEITFVRSLPQTVLAVDAHTGDLVAGQNAELGATGIRIATIGSGSPVLRGQVSVLAASGLHVGMTGQASSAFNNQTFRVRVTAISHRAAQEQGSAASEVSVELKPTSTLDPSFLGQNVGISITAKTTGNKVLIVPAVAVTTRADGSSYVTVVDGPDKLRTVEVKPGLSAEGYLAVTPINGALSASDSVAVGGH